MAQNKDEMSFCRKCKMNVFPTRPKFNIKIFGVFVIFMLILFSTITAISYSILSGLFLFIFIMWGFMILNPYLIYYITRQKENCPRCYYKVVEKNLEYQPFGKKEPEVFKKLATEKKFFNWHCPFCGDQLTQGAIFCKSCGKKFEINGD